MLRGTRGRTRPPLGRRPLRSGVMLLATAAMTVGLAGCSGDDEGGEKDNGGRPGSATEAVQTNARLGKVVGPLKKAKAEGVATEVTAVVERWLDQAYGGDYPRTDFIAAFGEFTKGARGLAAKQPGIMSNAAVGGDVEGVEFVQRVVRVDVVGPKGKPAGATARFRARFELGGLDRTDEVSGRLMLTPVKGGWQVFGFDVSREEGAK